MLEAVGDVYYEKKIAWERNMQTALTIAGSDSGAGAGIQADLKTFHAHGVYGLTAITAVTVQNTQRVLGVQEVDPEIVRDQILCLFEDFQITALKIGMVFNKAIIEAILESLERVKPQNTVLDTVMVSKSGQSLLQEEARETLVQRLLPRADLITPNIPEAQFILGSKIESLEDMYSAARKLVSSGASRVILKGGHLRLESGRARDIFYDGKEFLDLENSYINTRNTHGTGCTFSAALAANLALGRDYIQAAKQSKKYITGALSRSISLGDGHGPTNHFWEYSLGTG